MDELELEGEWWLPGEEEESRYGTVEYSPEKGGRLKLVGVLGEKEEYYGESGELERVRDIDKIYGVTRDNTRVTLTGCQGRVDSLGHSDASFYMNETIMARIILVGEHIDRKFDAVEVSFPNLSEWVGESPISISSSDRPLTTLELDHEDLNDIIVQVNEDLELEFNSESTVRPDRHNPEYSHSRTIRIKPDERLSLDRYLIYIKYLQEYLTLASKYVCYPSHVTGIFESDKKLIPNKSAPEILKEEGEEISPTYIDREIDIYHHIPRYEGASTGDPDFSIFRGSEVNIEESLSDWIDHSEECSTFHEMYFNNRYDPDMDIKFQFSSLCFGMESLFKQKYHRRYVDKEYHKKVVGEIAEILPDREELEREGVIEDFPNEDTGDGKNPYSKRVENLVEAIGHQYSLKDQLETITNENQDVLSELIDVDSTLSEIRDLRHNIAHGLEGEFDLEHVSDVYHKTRIITEVYLLSVVGLEDDEIEQKIRRMI